MALPGRGDAYADSLSGLGLPTYAYRIRESSVNIRTRFAYAQIGLHRPIAPGRGSKGRLCLQEPLRGRWWTHCAERGGTRCV
jgi:hypothetical protein